MPSELFFDNLTAITSNNAIVENGKLKISKFEMGDFNDE